MASLIQDVRSEQNVFSAWRHVKKNALNSPKGDIRGAASEFEHSHQRHIRRIITQLREDRFNFDPVTGVLKDAKKRIAAGKDPRPIAIATLKNRIVQRAILQVLQPRRAIDPKDVNVRYEVEFDHRLGKINEVNRSKFGVGGLMYPYGGVEPAIKLVREAIDSGSNYFYQSDIRSFFSHIPTKQVVQFVRTQTKDDALSDLFERALAVHLGNEDELKGYSSLFPKGGIGVAQGSSLSAFAGNVLLYDLDHQLNKNGVTAVRYIDDILMVAADEGALDAAVKHADHTLRSFGFGLYAPAKGSDKAARGECSDAINFLGCTIQPKRCVPSAASVSRLKDEINKSLSESKAAIQSFLRSNKALASKSSKTATLDIVGKRIYGWQKAFSFCTDSHPFEQLDDFVSRQVHDYEAFVMRNLSGTKGAARMRVLGIPSTMEMFFSDRVRKNSRMGV
ncbi:reverse transcriptase domain-containing protein [Agrobacterium sp. NPDC090273]|uniref:reverse transcriptase domain-containing protein n=1 Tax=Agrobacterium sp. NPDC090273 TaxID=3363919 RepID=UPI00383A2991